MPPGSLGAQLAEVRPSLLSSEFGHHSHLGKQRSGQPQEVVTAIQVFDIWSCRLKENIASLKLVNNSTNPVILNICGAKITCHQKKKKLSCFQCDSLGEQHHPPSKIMCLLCFSFKK